MVALVDRPQMIPAEGPIADPIYGYHTLWAAQVPFITAHMGRAALDPGRYRLMAVPAFGERTGARAVVDVSIIH